MSITIHPALEARIRAGAEAAGMSVEAYLERLVHDEEAATTEIEDLVMEGINSGEPLEAGPGYWEEKHRRLDERLIEASRAGVRQVIRDKVKLTEAGMSPRKASKTREEQQLQEQPAANEVLILPREASTIFVNALLNPPEPNQALRAAAKRYKKLVREPSWSKKS